MQKQIEEVLFEWSDHSLSFTDSKARNTLDVFIIDPRGEIRPRSERTPRLRRRPARNYGEIRLRKAVKRAFD